MGCLGPCNSQVNFFSEVFLTKVSGVSSCSLLLAAEAQQAGLGVISAVAVDDVPKRFHKAGHGIFDQSFHSSQFPAGRGAYVMCQNTGIEAGEFEEEGFRKQMSSVKGTTANFQSQSVVFRRVWARHSEQGGPKLWP